MFGRNSINGSVEWLGVPNFLKNYVPTWTLNLLAPYAHWGDRGSSTSTKLGSGSGGYYDGVSINWNIPACVLPIYHWRIFEKTYSAARRAQDKILWRTTHTACKAITLLATPYIVVWLTGRMTPGMIAGIYLFVNNLWG